MPPTANPSHAPFTFVNDKHAGLATKHSFAATTYPFLSACFAAPHSHIRNYTTSDSLSPSFTANSLDTKRTFYSHKNKPCFPQHKLPSPMTGSFKTLTHKSRTSPHKSSNSPLFAVISCKLNVNYCTRIIPTTFKTPRPSFIAAPIRNATASCLPLGSVPLVTSTHVHTAANSRPHTTTRYMSAIPTPSLPLPFLRPTLNLALIARFPFTKPTVAIKCFALYASAFGLGTLDALKLADTTPITCNGCAKTTPAGYLANMAMFFADAKLILPSFHACIMQSSPLFAQILHYAPFCPTLSAGLPPSLICAFMIFLASSLTPSPSTFTFARRSLQTRFLQPNSSTQYDATTLAHSNSTPFILYWMPSFKPPPTSLSAFFTILHPTPTTTTTTTHSLHFNTNFTLSSLTLTTNSTSFTTTSTPLHFNTFSFILTLSNLFIRHLNSTGTTHTSGFTDRTFRYATPPPPLFFLLHYIHTYHCNAHPTPWPSPWPWPSP